MSVSSPADAPARRSLRSRLARGLRLGAGFFVVFSLVQLVWSLVVLSTGPGAATAIFGATSHDLGPVATGLRYSGEAGVALAGIQLVAVLSALLLTVVPKRGARRMGHTILIAWAGLWTANLIGLAGAAPEVMNFGRAGLMSLLFGCTLGRAGMAWWWSPKAKRAVEVPPADAVFPADDVDASTRHESPASSSAAGLAAPLGRAARCSRSVAQRFGNGACGVGRRAGATVCEAPARMGAGVKCVRRKLARHIDPDTPAAAPEAPSVSRAQSAANVVRRHAAELHAAAARAFRNSGVA